ncbi:DUF58 domain-containing protein [Litorihabitans aurantiacus]|uniref:DUF58 domain-containing protein n=1 Tax=Litorihabitans aurantiacus TaxID=1930061 RepID=A0AA37UR02_9MICO|nr:DUF58 domain-containing protein [Litorihabitans aurantiacus]GMA30968.1 hypothetical protein GCM10025875_09600 [Litorihabitans aurantiacus]
MSAPSSTSRRPTPVAGTTTLGRLFRGTRATRSTLQAGLRQVTPVLGWASPTAWVALAVAVAALVAAHQLGWVELAALGWGLGAVLLAASAFMIGRHPYEVRLRLREHRVTVGDRAVGGITVRNVGDRRVLPARIELPVGAGRAGFALPSLAAGQEHEDLFAIPTSRRAVISVGPVSSVRGDPVGLVRRTVTWTKPQDLYVHPRTVRLTSSHSGLVHDLEGRESQDLTASDLTFHALREYAPGDDRRSIHWRSSARTGTLMVRQFVETRRSQLVIALSCRPEDYGKDAEEFELAISALGSYALQAVREQRDIAAVTTRETLRASTPDALLDSLTAVEQGAGGQTLTETCRAVARDYPRAAIIVLGVGSEPGPREVRAMASVLPLGAQVIAVRAQPGAPTAVRRLPGLTSIVLGDLADLPRAQHRSEL